MRVAAAMLGALCCEMAGLAAAQPAAARVSGRVIDKTSGSPIARAELMVLGDPRSATSDSSGRFLLSALQPGPTHIVVRAAQFPSTEIVVNLSAGDAVDRTIALDSTAAGSAPHSLPGVAVTAPAVSYRLVDFERRRRTGRGQYLTRTEIEKGGASTLQEAVCGMRGVTTECGGGRGCFVRMTRAPMQCLPDFVIDGRVNNNFGPFTPIRDIEAIEVYTGPSDVPGEFAGATAGCGVIVVWTRSGPPPKNP